MIALAEAPALTTHIAAPRDRTNQRFTIVAAGVWMPPIPAAPRTPKAR